MTARRLLFAGTVIVAWLVAPAAGAIPNTCPTSGPDAGTVNINEPPAGATFAGQVTVRGRASAPTGLTRVELFVGEALKDFQLYEPSKTDVEFLLRFEVASVQTTTAIVSVVACGGAPGAAVRGIASVNIKVDRVAVTTTPPIPVTPVDRTDDRPGTETRTGPAWVGVVFGLAGLGGLVAANRLRGAREAIAPSADGGAGAAPPGPGRRPRPADGDGGSPPRPNRARRAAAGPAVPVVPDGPPADGTAPGATGPAAGEALAVVRRPRAGSSKAGLGEGPGSDGHPRS